MMYQFAPLNRFFPAGIVFKIGRANLEVVLVGTSGAFKQGH
jgi:hypothetical protein